MKLLKFLFIIAAFTLCTGLKAADTLSVRDLSYQIVKVGAHDVTFSDSLTENDAVLADCRAGHHAKGYKLIINTPMMLLLKADGNSIDTYSFLFNENFEEIAGNDDYDHSTTGYAMSLKAGVYYWVITTYRYFDVNFALTLTCTHINAYNAGDLYYTPVAVNSAITDSVTANAAMLQNVRAFHYAQGYTFYVESSDYGCVNMNLKVSQTPNRWHAIMYLLDEHFNVIASEDYGYNNELQIKAALSEGKYYVLISQRDYDDFGEYSLTLNGEKLYERSEITYSLIAPDTTFTDSVTNYSANIKELRITKVMRGNGYIAVLSQGDVLQMSAVSDDNISIQVLDSNYKVLCYGFLPDYDGFKFRAAYTGTYYFLVLSTVNQLYNISFLYRTELRDNIYYVDAVNGSNQNDGITPQTPLATLDYAITSKIIPHNGGMCYLMSNARFDAGKYDLNNVCMSLLPYEGRDIIIRSDNMVQFHFDYSYMEIGHKDSGSITILVPNGSSAVRFMDVRISNLILNNVSIHDVECECLIRSYESNLELNNCNIEKNATPSGSLIYCKGTFKCNNTTIADNGGNAIIQLYACISEMENTQLTGNESNHVTIEAIESELYITNGVMDTNISTLPRKLPDNILKCENVGGIMSVWSTVYVNGNFNMNNNYMMLVNGAVLTLGDSITAGQVGVLLPVTIPEYSKDYDEEISVLPKEDISFNYYEGEPVLVGNVYDNYKRFGLYEPSEHTQWYLLSDGTLAKHDDVAVTETAQAHEVEVNIYPNPTSGMLYIHTQCSEAVSVRLADMQGRILSTQSVQGESVQLNMQSLAHGMYFVQIMSKEGVLATRKVVRK